MVKLSPETKKLEIMHAYVSIIRMHAGKYYTHADNLRMRPSMHYAMLPIA